MALGYTHTHTHILWRNESDFEKPGRPANVRLVKKIATTQWFIYKEITKILQVLYIYEQVN